MSNQQRKAIGAKNADEQVRLVRQLREIRVNNHISVHQVAADMGVDQTMVYRFERGGTNFTASTLRKYAKAVGALLSLGAFPASHDPGCQSGHIPDTPHDRRAARQGSIRVSTATAKHSPPSSTHGSSSSSHSPGWAMSGILSSTKKELMSHE